MSLEYSSKEELVSGIWVYRDVIKKELDIINRLELAIKNSKGMHTWRDATVGYREKKPEYRDCVDFKWKKFEADLYNKYNKEVDGIWQDVYDAQKIALDDYCSFYNIEMNYWEAMNFIKYGPGQHFSYHADHGWSYISTVSMVAYINDDYEDGGLRFDKFDLTIKPTAGDLYIFPSTFLFSHAALPVKSGLKYSIVTMTDYNDKTHNEQFYKQFMSDVSIKDY